MPLQVLAGPDVFTDVPDGTPVSFDVGTQPPGFYYVEWTEPTGTSLGIFGADTDVYDGGKAWRDREPIDDGIWDFYMALTTDTGELNDWIIEKKDGDPNKPLALRQGHPDLPPEEYTSLGQSLYSYKRVHPARSEGCTLDHTGRWIHSDSVFRRARSY